MEGIDTFVSVSCGNNQTVSFVIIARRLILPTQSCQLAITLGESSPVRDSIYQAEKKEGITVRPGSSSVSAHSTRLHPLLQEKRMTI